MGSADEEYDEDEDVEDNSLPGEDACDKCYKFKPKLYGNYYPFNDQHGNLLVGMCKSEDILITGSFQLQIVKGGITYNNVHYNASWKALSMWHPTSNSIPVISSSYYAGWDEKIFLDDKFKDRLSLDEFECVIKLSNGAEGLLDITKLHPTFSSVWLPQKYTLPQVDTSKTTFALLSLYTTTIPKDLTTLKIPKGWADKVDLLSLFHKNCTQDMRVIVIGGKNSGKSTLLRLLLQRFLHGDSTTDSVQYLDLDPGQPEYSKPECISLSKVDRACALGQHFCQASVDTIAQHYIGTPSPQDFPNEYLVKVDKLIESFDEENFMGATLVNLPGWIKGFGIQILNRVISGFKPTHVVFLESAFKKSSEELFHRELQIPSPFSTIQRECYDPIIYKLDSYFQPISDETPTYHQTKFHAAQIRQLKMLSYFHKVRETKLIKYDFEPLLKRKPFQISFGSQGIKAFQFFDDFGGLHQDDIKGALEGTIVALHLTEQNIKTASTGSFPILKEKVNLEFITLALVHSIDVSNKFINIYIPEFEFSRMPKDSNIQWVLLRGKTDTPIHEIYPPNNMFLDHRERALPYISFDKRKRYEHVWKVRKNVMRRGHAMK